MKSFICRLCPRRCGALRTEDKNGGGLCGMPAMPVIARAALHFGEEPCISGKNGSGTIFFAGCPLGCIFCQNEGVSHGNVGKTVTVQRVKEIGWELIRQGAHNLNFVTPTHYAHVVSKLLTEHPNIILEPEMRYMPRFSGSLCLHLLLVCSR